MYIRKNIEKITTELNNKIINVEKNHFEDFNETLNYLLIFLPIAVTLVMASQLESGFNQFPYFIYSDGSYFYLEGEKLVSSGFDFVVLEAVHFKYYGHIVLNALSLYLIDDLVISGMLLKLFSLLLWSVCIYKVYVKFYFKIRGDKLYLYLFSILFFVAIWYSMTNLRDSFVSLIVLSFTLILLKHKLILQDYLYLSLLVLLIVFFRYEYLIFVMIAILLYLLTNKFIKFYNNQQSNS